MKLVMLAKMYLRFSVSTVEEQLHQCTVQYILDEEM
jgi:hypothetical protein